MMTIDMFMIAYLAQLAIIVCALFYNVLVWASGGNDYVTTYARANAAIGYAILIHQQMTTIMLALHFYY